MGKLSPELREDALRRSGIAIDTAKGGLLLATGTLVRAGSAQIATFLAARGRAMPPLPPSWRPSPLCLARARLGRHMI